MLYTVYASLKSDYSFISVENILLLMWQRTIFHFIQSLWTWQSQHAAKPTKITDHVEIDKKPIEYAK